MLLSCYGQGKSRGSGGEENLGAECQKIPTEISRIVKKNFLLIYCVTKLTSLSSPGQTSCQLSGSEVRVTPNRREEQNNSITEETRD